MRNKRTRKLRMRGGDWFSDTKDKFSSWGSTLSSSISNLWNKPNATTTPYIPPSTETPITAPSTVIGGRSRRYKRRRRGKKIGGTPGYTPVVGLASTGAPFSGETAKPHNWVGGKKRNRTSKK